MVGQKTFSVKDISKFVLGEITPQKIYGSSIAKIASVFYYTLDTTSIIMLADKLEEDEDILAVGLVDKHGKALGIITRKDLLGLLSKPFGREVLRKKTAASLLSDVQRFNINTNIFTVSELLDDEINSNNTNYFLIVNDKDEFCGIFSGKDMLVFLAEITRQDIALSRKIQTRIVKEKDDLERPEFSLCASSIMAKGIGGDYYSFKKITDADYLIVLCDVSGKGMAASLLSSLLSGFMNTYPIENDLKPLIIDLNSQLTRSFAGDKFVTGIFLLFNETTGRLQIADMGHTHYMFYRNGRLVKPSAGKGNIPLGISTELEVNTFSILMERDDCFFLMTDGLIEQKNEDGKTFSLNQINNVLKGHTESSAQELRSKLLKDFNKFRGKSARQDDITFLFLKYSPEQNNSERITEQKRKNAIEDKIKWALETQKPIQIRTNRYLPEDRDFIDSVLDRFLNEAGIKFLMNKISYCVHELATNAKKANTKRVYFKSKKLDINDLAHYKLGMKNFKTDTLENINHYLDMQKKQGYFIVVMFQLTKKALKITVVNNSEMTDDEKKKIQHKLSIAKKNVSIGDVYDQIEDYSEGAGLGIVMMSQMLRTMGFGQESLSIISEDGLTSSTIQIDLRE